MNSKMSKEIILINPRYPGFVIGCIQNLATRKPIPYSLLTLAALSPQGYKVRIINQKNLWLPGDFTGAKLVGITCLTSNVWEGYLLADKFRKAGSRVVMGGPHVTAMPDEALKHADSVVLGEGESVWPTVVRDFENNCMREIYKGEPLEDFFSPVFDYFIKTDRKLLSRVGIHIDRGCKYHCDFCARISNRLRFVKIEQVIALVERIKGPGKRLLNLKPLIVFGCDNIYSSPNYAKELFKKIAPFNIRWGANCSIDIGFDIEALQLAKASGCRGLLIGFETIHPEDYQKTSLKEVHSAEDYKIAINNIRSHGIKIIGSFIMGLDNYKNIDYLKLWWFLVRARLWHFYLTILTPFPGSELFDRLKKEGRILSFDWRKYNLLFCVIRLKNTSIFNLYIWFILIRASSVLFSPALIILWLTFNLSLMLGSGLGEWFKYNFLK